MSAVLAAPCSCKLRSCSALPPRCLRLHGLRVAVKTGDCYNCKDVVQRLKNEVAAYKALHHLQGVCIPRLEEHGYAVSTRGSVCWSASALTA